MTKAELVQSILAHTTEVNKRQAEAVLDAIAATVTTTLNTGGDITLPGIGKFTTSRREARTARNPSNGETVEVPAKTVVKFGVAKALKDAVNS